MKDKTNGSDLTAAQQKLNAAQAQKTAAIKNQNSAQAKQSSAQSLFDNTEQYTKEAKQITTTDETGKTIKQTIYEQILNPKWEIAFKALNSANSELSAANEELSAAEEEKSTAEKDLSEAEEEPKEAEENTEQITLSSSKTAQSAENISYTETSSSNGDTEGNLGQDPDLAIIQENSDGTHTYLGVEGLKQNQDGSWTDKNGNRVEIESTYQNAGFETDGILTLTVYEADKTTKKSYNTAYNMYSEEIYDENNNCIQRSSASYNDKGEIINQTKQTPIDGDNWMVESTNGNYIYNEKYDLCYATDENNNKCDGYYYSTVDLAIQAGNILKNGGTPLTQSEIQDYITNIHNAKNKDALTEILNNENLTSDNLVSIITAYNNKYAGVESSDNKSRVAYNNKYGLTESFFNDKPKNSFINHLDKVLSGKNRENVMKLVTEKMISSSENGNSYATDILAREIYNSTAGKIGTSDEFIMNIVNDNTNSKVLSDVMERYSVVNNGRNIIKDVENDFNPLLDSSVFDTVALKKTLNNAFKANHNGMSYEEYLKAAQTANDKPTYIGEENQTKDTNTDTNKPQDLPQDPNIEFWPKAYKVGDKTCYKVAGVDGLMLNGFSIADHDIYGNKIQTENAVEYYMGSSNNCTIWIQDETTGKTTKVTYDKSTRTRTEEIYDSEKYYKQSFVQYDETGKVIDWSNTSVQPTQSNQSAKTTDNTNMAANTVANTASMSQSPVNSTENAQENKDNLTASLINTNTPVANKASATSSSVDNLNRNTKDDKIGNTKQGKTGDCYLLSAINSLSYTDKGKEIIANALDYKENGSTTVHFVTGDVTITQEEVNQAESENKYSSGDEDMIIFELAVKKVAEDIETGKIEKPEAFENMISQLSGDLEGGNQSHIYYLLTGNKGEILTDNNEITDALNYYKDNQHKDFNVSCAIGGINGTVGNKTVTDINGNEVKLYYPHAYAIQDVSDNTVTVINPWDSGKKIELSKKTFIETFNTVDILDLSENNGFENWITEQDKNREIINQVRYNYDCEYDSDGNIISKRVHTDYGSAGLKYEYDKDGNAKILIYDIDENGNTLDHAWYVSEEEAEKIIERGLLNVGSGWTTSSGLSNDIYTSKLYDVSNEKWEKLKEFFYNVQDGRMNIQTLGQISTLSTENIEEAFWMITINEDLPPEIVYMRLSGGLTEEEFQQYIKDHNINYRTYEDIFGKNN